MSKYEPLEHFLRQQPGQEVPMSFEQIEGVIGARLPPAAHAHRAWWSNNPSNNVMTKSWLAAGFVSERVDIESRRLVFRRRPRPAPAAERPRSDREPGLVARIQAHLAGTVRVAPGVDLTAPIGEVWDAER